VIYQKTVTGKIPWFESLAEQPSQDFQFLREKGVPGLDIKTLFSKNILYLGRDILSRKSKETVFPCFGDSRLSKSVNQRQFHFPFFSE
jgi:hypothetical protein